MEVHNRDEADRLLREANIFRVRRQLDQAEEKCRAALAVAPEDPGAMELLGDLLRERDQMEKAAEQYRLALAQSPGKASVEKKYAEVTLELAERQRLRELAELALNQPAAARASSKKRSVTMALIFALVWPGLGQFYLAQGLNAKGLILAVLSLLCLPGLVSLSGMMLVFAGVTRASGGDSTALFGLLFFLLWIYGIGDTLAQSQKSSSESTDRLGF